MKYFCECLYCGHKWDHKSLKAPVCPVCDDTRIRKRKEPERGNYFGYDEEPKKSEIPDYNDWSD